MSTINEQPYEEKHLFVLSHGLFGNPVHVKYIRERLEKEFRPKGDEEDQYGIETLIITGNSGLRSYDGVRVGGLRMVEEILDYIRENQKKNENSKTKKKKKRYTKISFVGYSLGGLWCRYAIGELYKRNILIKNKITPDQQHQQQPLDKDGDIKLEPIIYNTFATPHLGSKFQGSKFKAKLFNTVGGSILGYSGKDLFLKPAKETGSECVITGSNNYNDDDDDENVNVSSQQNGGNLAQDTKDEDIVDESELPLLYIMTDPSREFYKGLALFKHRILYSNAVNDRTVPFFTSYISVQDPFKKKGHVIKRMTFATAIDGNSASSSSSSTHSTNARDDDNDYIEGTIIDTKWSRYVANPKQPSEELKEIFNRIHKKQEEKRKVLRAAKKKRAQQKLAASSPSPSPIGPNTTSKKVIATKYKNIVLVKEDHLFQKTQKNALSTVLFVGSLLFPVIIMVSTVVSLISQYRVNTITSKEKQLNGDQEAISRLYSSGNPYDEDEGDETTGEDSTKRRRRRSVIGDEVAELTGEAVDGFAPGNTASSKKEGDDGENGQSIIDPDDEDFLQLHHTHSHVEDEVEEGVESDEEEEEEDSDDEDVDYDEEDLESLNHLESELHSLQQENYSNGVPLLAEKRLEEEDNDCQFAKEIPRLNLSPIVQKMAHNLNSLTWDKRIVMLTNYLNAHGPMINRRQLHKRDGRIVNDWAKSLVSKL